MNKKNFNLKKIAKKSITNLVALSVVVSGMLIPAQSSFAVTLHPTGLTSLTATSGYAAAPTYNTSNLPTSLDLTYMFPPVGDQASQGSCVAFAVGYAAQSYQVGHDHSYTPTTSSQIFSPQYIYSQIHSGTDSLGGGCSFDDAFNLIKTQGCTTLADMPYSGAPFGWQTQPTAQQIANAANHKIYTWESLPSGNVSQIKAELANMKPVVIGIPVYPDFDNLSSTNDTYDDSTGSLRGYHALCVVGYDDTKNAVKVENSWGTNWGLNGYGWISYNLIQSLNLPSYTMPVTPILNFTNRSGLTCQFQYGSGSITTGGYYGIFRKCTGTSDQPTLFIQTTNTTTSFDTSFGSYDYSVAFLDSTGNRISDFSNVKTVEAYQAAPANFVFTNRSGLSCQFGWTSVAGTRYAIFIKPTGSVDQPVKVAGSETTNSSISITIPFGSSDVCVAAIDSAGNRISDFSNVKTVEA